MLRLSLNSLQAFFFGIWSDIRGFKVILVKKYIKYKYIKYIIVHVVSFVPSILLFLCFSLLVCCKSLCLFACNTCMYLDQYPVLSKGEKKLFTSQKMLNNLCMSIHEIIIDYHIFLCWPQVVRAKERLDEELRMQEKENVQQKQTTGESET